MPSSIPVTLRDVTLELLADRAIFWPDQRTLFVADLHWGKAGTFRHFGIPVPETASPDLKRLSDLISQHQATHLVVLGDLTHHHTGVDPQLVDIITRWRRTHSQLRITLVRGNHDRHLKNLPDEWQIESIPAPVALKNVICQHEPAVFSDDHPLVLAGHLHPRVELQEGYTHRVKCHGFWYSQGCLVLPAFSSFVDGGIVKPSANDRVWVTFEDQILEVPTRR